MRWNQKNREVDPMKNPITRRFTSLLLALALAAALAVPAAAVEETDPPERTGASD